MLLAEDTMNRTYVMGCSDIDTPQALTYRCQSTSFTLSSSTTTAISRAEKSIVSRNRPHATSGLGVAQQVNNIWCTYCSRCILIVFINNIHTYNVYIARVGIHTVAIHCAEKAALLLQGYVMHLFSVHNVATCWSDYCYSIQHMHIYGYLQQRPPVVSLLIHTETVQYNTSTINVNAE